MTIIEKLVQQLAPSQGEMPSEAFALALSLQAAMASQPLSNPQKLEAQPEAQNGEPDPAKSSELLEAKAMVLDHLMSPEIDGRTAKARLIEYRTGVLAIAKHKGAQS